MVRRVPDVSKLNQLTGFTPTVSLEDALKSIIADQRARLRKLGVLTYV
jgi:nucleoside-diphosphate-sugar epimerase